MLCQSLLDYYLAFKRRRYDLVRSITYLLLNVSFYSDTVVGDILKCLKMSISTFDVEQLSYLDSCNIFTACRIERAFIAVHFATYEKLRDILQEISRAEIRSRSETLCKTSIALSVLTFMLSIHFTNKFRFISLTSNTLGDVYQSFFLLRSGQL